MTKKEEQEDLGILISIVVEELETLVKYLGSNWFKATSFKLQETNIPLTYKLWRSIEIMEYFENHCVNLA